jgi:type IV pilus biogenesis protein PilP
VSTASDALALPAPQQFETDMALASVVSPPPFGQRTTLDSNGLVIPTPEGVVTEEGFTLIAASPPLKPPSILTRPDTSAVQQDPSAEVPAAVAQLAAFRPQNRPLGLAEQAERADLGGVTLGELAVYRPLLRPQSVQERAAEPETPEVETQDDANAAAARAAAAAAATASALIVPQPTIAAVAPAVENATRLATARSARPDTRPRNFARIVNRAQQAAPRAETRVAAAAQVAPRTVAPSIPSSASVSRSATVKNAINLRRVNLIGVYGKPSGRRALIRLSNGRYEKVKVGDRLDGGRVSAISNSELRYTKGGRNVVLQMP